MEIVLRELLKILKSADLEVSDTGTWPARIKDEVERWLSDWHLVTFLCMHGSFSADEQKLLCQVATAHRFPEQSPAREHLFASGGWLTLLTLAEATSAAMSPPASSAAAEQFAGMGINSSSSSPAAAGSGTGTPGAGSGANAGGPKACPHCTFINEVGATDCDVCGLPL
jgi:nuclear protein localization family protein 4